MRIQKKKKEISCWKKSIINIVKIKSNEVIQKISIASLFFSCIRKIKDFTNTTKHLFYHELFVHVLVKYMIDKIDAKFS